MVSTLIDKSRDQEVAYHTIANRLEQTKRELDAHRAEARERAENCPDLKNRTPIFGNARVLGTPEFPCARSGRYEGESSQKTSQPGLAYQSLNYSGLNEVHTRTQGPQSHLGQTQNMSTERPEETRPRGSPMDFRIPDNRVPPIRDAFQTQQTKPAYNPRQNGMHRHFEGKK